MMDRESHANSDHTRCALATNGYGVPARTTQPADHMAQATNTPQGAPEDVDRVRRYEKILGYEYPLYTLREAANRIRPKAAKTVTIVYSEPESDHPLPQKRDDSPSVLPYQNGGHES